MKLVFIDGNVAVGETPKDLLRYLKVRDFSLPTTIREYMNTVAQRVSEMGLGEVSTASVDGFIESLERLGLAKVEEE